MIELTVAICTYNGAARLPQVLDRLVTQIDTQQFLWEIIVIDNNSRDRTADVVHQYQAQSHQFSTLILWRLVKDNYFGIA